jgi:phospholipase/carboxylesterase
LKRALFIAVLLAIIAAALIWLRVLTAPLDAVVVGGSGPPSLVLLHGYGSRAEDWHQFEPEFSLPAKTQVHYLQAPLRGPWSGRRGWWWLNLEGHVPAGQTFADYSTIHPPGIRIASRLVRNYLANLEQPLILGGFSQGAMTSAEVAFRSDQELAGLILLSGTTVDEAGWADSFVRRRGLPVFIAHGRRDPVLPFDRMERFAGSLKAHGVNVTWLPFDGDHAIPREVVAGINRFVTTVLQRDTPH